MTLVKVCGVTNVEDALAALEAGADLLGFNFYARSPRYVSPAEARKIIERLPEGVTSVGVFVNEPSPADVERIAREAGLRDEVIDAISRRARPAHLEPDEALLFDFADETVWQGEPSDASYDGAVARWSRATVLDLLAVCGYYTMLAFVLNAARLPLPTGTAPLRPLS